MSAGFARAALAVTMIAGFLGGAGPAFANLCTTNPDACGPKPTPPPTPAVVSSLTVTNITPSSAQLSWFDNSTNEDSFTIIRWKYYGPGQMTASVVTLPAHPGTGPMSWQDTGLDSLTNYQWLVAATLNGAYHTPPPSVSTWTLGPVVPSGSPAAAPITAFENDQTSGVFPQVGKVGLLDDLIRVVNDPLHTVDQSQTGLCGPAAIEVELARRNPAGFVNAVRSIFESGQFQAGSATYSASSDLRASGAHASVSPANWLFMATIRDAGNASMRITDQTAADSVAWITMPGEEEGWMQQILGYSTVAHQGKSLGRTMGTAMNQAASVLTSGGTVILLIDASMLQPPQSGNPIPNHYIDVRSWSPSSPTDTFSAASWGSIYNLTVAWQTFDSDTFDIYSATN
ncbi:MAG: hypothetical protein QOH66_1919 [Actinomycetota bacterium]|nr:hypothetical protein [Actinomycetota bacterium]